MIPVRSAGLVRSKSLISKMIDRYAQFNICCLSHPECFRDHTVKDHLFLEYKAKPDLVIKLDQRSARPEPGRTSRACGIRLSQNKQNTALQASVNKNARIFARSGSLQPIWGAVAAIWLESPAVALRLSQRLPAETDCSAFHHQFSTFCDLLITYFTFVAAG